MSLYMVVATKMNHGWLKCLGLSTEGLPGLPHWVKPSPSCVNPPYFSGLRGSGKGFRTSRALFKMMTYC